MTQAPGGRRRPFGAGPTSRQPGGRAASCTSRGSAADRAAAQAPASVRPSRDRPTASDAGIQLCHSDRHLRLGGGALPRPGRLRRAVGPGQIVGAAHNPLSGRAAPRRSSVRASARRGRRRRPAGRRPRARQPAAATATPPAAARRPRRRAARRRQPSAASVRRAVRQPVQAGPRPTIRRVQSFGPQSSPSGRDGHGDLGGRPRSARSPRLPFGLRQRLLVDSIGTFALDSAPSLRPASRPPSSAMDSSPGGMPTPAADRRRRRRRWRRRQRGRHDLPVGGGNGGIFAQVWRYHQSPPDSAPTAAVPAAGSRRPPRSIP